MADRRDDTDLHAVIRVLRRRGSLIALCLIVATGAALAASLAQTKRYSASASLLFRDPGFDRKLFGTDTVIGSSSDPARQAATNVKLVSLHVVADRTAAQVGGISSDAVASKMSISSDGQSDLVKITATDPSPELAARLANTFAREYIAFRQAADRQSIEQADRLVEGQLARLSPAERNSARGRVLADRAEQLQILASLQTGNAELVQPARVATSPSSPKVLRNTALGAALGLLLGVGLAFLFERLDRRLRDPEELEAAYRMPVVGAIPGSRSLAGGKSGRQRLDPPDGEAFAMLRARLRYFNVDREIRSILVTSAEPRDGKTTVAWYLAAMAALRGAQRVLLVEADLRRPTMATQHDILPGPGLAELLTHDLLLEEVLQHVPGDSQNGGGLGGDFDVIASGALPPNPAELLESDKMATMMQTFSASYDFVVIDTPPTSAVSDAIPLMTQVDGVLAVGRLGKTTRPSAVRLHDQLVGLHAPILGLVANDLKLRQPGYYYGYESRGRGEVPESQPPAPAPAPAPTPSWLSGSPSKPE
jgi:tyrosine-protein kinase